MGYTTKFKGAFTLSRKLTLDEFNRLMELNECESGEHGSDAPDSYCQWQPTRDGTGIKWDGNEKFYDYAEWLQWLMDHPLKEMGITVSGAISFQGESVDDCGMLVIEGGRVIKRERTATDAERKARAILEMIRKDRRANLDNSEDYAEFLGRAAKIIEGA